MDIVTLLKAERDRIARQLSGLNTAIQALSESDTTQRRTRGRWHMSAAAKAKISATKKEWWAKRKGGKVVSIARKSRISAAGLARIRAAQRARWAKVKGGKRMA
jgi:hypothetical protein